MERATTATPSGSWKWHHEFPGARPFQKKTQRTEVQQPFHHIDPKNLSELLSPVEAEPKRVELELDTDSSSGPSPRTIAQPSLRPSEIGSFFRPEPQPSAATGLTSTAARRMTTAGHICANNSEDGVSQDPLRRPSAPSTNHGTTHANICHLRERLRGWGLYFLKDARNADAMIQAVSISPDTPILSAKEKEKEPVVKLEPVSSDEEREAWEAIVKKNQSQSPQDLLTMNAIVWPRNGKRSRFLIQRTFNVAELRATIPDPSAESNRRFSMPTTRLITRQSATRAKRILTRPTSGPFSPPSSSPPTSATLAPSSAPHRRVATVEAPTRTHPFLSNAKPIRKSRIPGSILDLLAPPPLTTIVPFPRHVESATFFHHVLPNICSS